MEDLKAVVSKNIIFLRTKNHMTQFELGEKLNYSDKAVSKWERGESVPDAYILKKMSELFHVSVDYLLNSHSEKEKCETVAPHGNHSVITKITVIGIWTLAILAFVILRGFGFTEWLVFVYAVPVSSIVLLILNTLWGKQKNNFYIISLLVWSLIASVYLSFLQYNWWLLFALGVPAEAIIYLSFKLRKKIML